MIPIVYGLPGDGMFRDAEKGRVILGGCVIHEGAPTQQCEECGKESGGLKFRSSYGGGLNENEEPQI